MKGLPILLIAIVLLPVLILAVDMGGDMLAPNATTALGERYFTSITDTLGWFDKLGELGRPLYNIIIGQDFEMPEPNQNNEFYSAWERDLMADWEVENGSMTKFKRWTLQMKYFFKMGTVDTNIWNAEYSWSISNPYLKYKT